MALSMGVFWYGYTKNFQMFIAFITLCIIVIISIRSQFAINDKQFLSSMIEHHSAAITMSKQINKKTQDKRIRKLADNIISSQSSEIDLMNVLLKN